MSAIGLFCVREPCADLLTRTSDCCGEGRFGTLRVAGEAKGKRGDPGHSERADAAGVGTRAGEAGAGGVFESSSKLFAATP
eukprot:925748-Prorocentrum_minimum.AAC.1